MSVVAVTSNSLAKRISFRESSSVLAQANYRKLQGTVKRKWNKTIFNFKSKNSHSFSTYFHVFFHMKMKYWYFDSQLATWDRNRNYCSFFMLKIFSYQKEETSKTETFNIILKHIFPKNFIEFPQVFQKI